MRPFNVEVFTQDFEYVANTNVNSINYKEDYLSSDDNTITVFALKGIKKQDYIRMIRGKEEYAGIITEITYGTDKSKELQNITFKPLMELLNTSYLFDLNKQGVGTLEQFLADAITEMFILNSDVKQNITGLRVETTTETLDWSFHITPSDSGGHYNIVNLLDSVIIPALEKYSVLVHTKLDIQSKELVISIGRAFGSPVIIECDLPNILKKNLVIRQASTDVNKLILYDATTDYAETVTYYLHTDLSYDTFDRDRILPVNCEIRAIKGDENTYFKSACQNEAANKFANKSFQNLIELTMSNDDALVSPGALQFGQIVNVISEGVSYESILTGKEVGKNTKLIFGTVRLDLTKILRRNGNG